MSRVLDLTVDPEDRIGTPHPMAALLPGVLQEDEFVLGLTEALDTVIAPVLSTLDNLPSYFDPTLAPDDYVVWLAGWVGLLLDDTWPVDFVRGAVRDTVELYSWRGTRRGLEQIVRLYTGQMPELVEPGGTSWSLEDDPDVVVGLQPDIVVRLAMDEPDPVDRRRLERIIASAAPAHLAVRLEVVQP